MLVSVSGRPFKGDGSSRGEFPLDRKAMDSRNFNEKVSNDPKRTFPKRMVCGRLGNRLARLEADLTIQDTAMSRKATKHIVLPD
jgi:hypothetical protein